MKKEVEKKNDNVRKEFMEGVSSVNEKNPNTRDVLFIDTSCNAQFILKSAVETSETADFNGEVYPVFKIETSSKSHPAYTGERYNYEGMSKVDKFNKKYNLNKKQKKK